MVSSGVEKNSSCIGMHAMVSSLIVVDNNSLLMFFNVMFENCIRTCIHKLCLNSARSLFNTSCEKKVVYTLHCVEYLAL